MKDKRIAITGSHGFIGESLIQRLEKDNTIFRIERHAFYTSNFKEKLEIFNPDIIIHLAAYGNHSTQTEDMEMFEANIVKTFLLLRDSLDIPYEAFINVGTSSEYGSKPGAFREEDILEPLTMYAGTKAAGTMLSRAFAKKYDKPIVTVRPFSVYGPQEGDHRFIPTVVRSLIEEKKFDLESEAWHDWIYIDDLIEGILTACEYAKALSGQAVNIGLGHQYKNREVVDMLSFITNKTPKFKEKVLRPSNPKYWLCGNSTLKLCKWKPRVKLYDGLKKTFEYYKAKYGD